MIVGWLSVAAGAVSALLLVGLIAAGVELDRASAASLFGAAFTGILFGRGLARWAASPPAAPTPRIGRSAPATWLLAFVALLAFGEVALRAPASAALLAFPLANTLAAIAVALAIAGYVAWRIGGRPWPEVTAGFALGGCGVVAVALVLELMAALLLAGAVAAYLGATGELESVLQSLSALSESLEGEQVEPMAAMAIVNLPILIAVVLLFAVAAPIIEEAAKLAAAAAARPRSEAEAWWWGVLVGAGFGLIEAITISGVFETGWAVLMVVRGIDTVMHATLTGLASYGWFRATRGWAPGRMAVAIAFVGHMLWNGVVVAAAAALGASALYPERSEIFVGASRGLGLVAAALFSLLLVGFIQLSRRIGERSAPAVGS